MSVTNDRGREGKQLLFSHREKATTKGEPADSLKTVHTVYAIMSLRTLPLLYLNLGGEMMYVLDQRLHAQKVDGAKRAKGQFRVVGIFSPGNL